MPCRRSARVWWAIWTVALAAVTGGLPAPGRAEPRPSQEIIGHEFRSAASGLQACLDAQFGISERRRDSALDYADRIHRNCGSAIRTFLTAAREGAGGSRRVRGAVRAAITDAVLIYEARAAFLD
jgi:hypothetical protein